MLYILIEQLVPINNHVMLHTPEFTNFIIDSSQKMLFGKYSHHASAKGEVATLSLDTQNLHNPAVAT